MEQNCWIIIEIYQIAQFGRFELVIEHYLQSAWNLDLASIGKASPRNLGS